MILSTPRVERASAAGHADAAHLARTLGYTLVEGSDLTVRRGDVFLRSLAGLEPVHAVLRLLPDELCDPLDLDPRSGQGTPGLLAASCGAGSRWPTRSARDGWRTRRWRRSCPPPRGRSWGASCACPARPAGGAVTPTGRRRALDRLGEIVLSGVDG